MFYEQSAMKHAELTINCADALVDRETLALHASMFLWVMT